MNDYLKQIQHLDDEVYINIHKYHQLTIDMISDFEISVQDNFEAIYDKRDFIVSAGAHASWIVELADKANFSNDIDMLSRFSKVCFEWGNSINIQITEAA